MKFIAEPFNLYRKLPKSKKILFCGIASSLMLCLVLNFQLTKNTKTKNIAQLQKIEEDIKLSFEIYSHPLEGIKSGLFYNNLNFSAKNFRFSAESRNLYSNFKGALGFGFIRKVELKNLKQYLANQKKERPNFHLTYLKPQYAPRDFLNVIEIIEPIEVNSKAVGLVVSDEENRLEAAIIAMETGRPTITKSIQLVQTNKKSPGFLYYLPIYKTPITPSTKKERLEKIIGWSYAPLLASEIVEFVLKQSKNTIPFSLFEVNQNKSDNELFSNIHKSDMKYIDWENQITIAGQKWKIVANVSPKGITVDTLWSALTFILLCSLTNLISRHYQSIEKDIQTKNKIIIESNNAVTLATEELKTKERFLNKVINNLPALIGYWDNNLINKLSNIQYNNYFQKGPIEIHGKHISEILPAQVYQENLPYLNQALQGQEIEFERKLSYIDGSTKTVLTKYIPDFLDGEVIGFFVIVIDISKIKFLENENREKQAMLFAKSKLSSLGEMSSGIAHEINNPLAIISGRSQILFRQLSDLDIPTAKKDSLVLSAKSIVDTSNRIAAIIKGLRAFSRDSDNDPFETHQLISIINSTLDLSKEKLLDLNISIESIIADDLITINGNFVQLSQVIMNLISNAIDAITDSNNKWIKIQITKNDTHGIVRVIDNGLGISQDVLDKLMNPFFTTKPEGKGTGLGLSISKGIIEKHNGTLEYQLYEGHTSFVITIPLAKNTEQLDSLKKSA